MLPNESPQDESAANFSISENSSKEEIPNDLRMRYWETVEACPGVIADKTGFLGENHFHPLLIITNEEDPILLSELYSGSFDPILEERLKKGVFYRLAKMHVALYGEIQDPIYPGKGFRIEEIREPEASKSTTLEDGTQFIYVGDKNFEQVTEEVNATTKKVATKLAEMGIKSSTEGYLLILQDQLSIIDSMASSKTMTCIVGGHGADSFDSSDVGTVAAHELTHLKVFEYLRTETGFELNNLTKTHVLAATAEFLQEGVAVAVQEYCMETNARVTFKAAYSKMNKLAKDMLERGAYRPRDLNDEQLAVYYSYSDEPVANTHIHNRLLPGAFAEYCQHTKVGINEIVEILVKNGAEQKQKLSQETGIGIEDVSFDEMEMVQTLIKNPDVPSENIRPILNKFMRECDLGPFELLAKVLGKSEEQVTKEFLEWTLAEN